MNIGELKMYAIILSTCNGKLSKMYEIVQNLRKSTDLQYIINKTEYMVRMMTHDGILRKIGNGFGVLYTVNEKIPSKEIENLINASLSVVKSLNKDNIISKLKLDGTL